MLQIPAEAPQSSSAEGAPAGDESGALLGYAYLQKLASQASFASSLIGQHADGGGVDVLLHVREQLDPQSRLSDFSLDFQLRASSRGLPIVDNKLLFSLEVDRYENLRSAVGDRPRFIVLLSLPADFNGGDELTAEDLIAHRRGRWLCLSGAPQVANTTATPVRFPTWNVLTPAALREIARRVSLGLRFFHEQ
jgi:Domain of unknown function (DUF4365)